MRGRLGLLISGVCVAGILLACGSTQKDPKDPSEKTSSNDETPKWEGATNPKPDDPKETKTTKSGGSSGGAVQEAPRRRTDQYDKEGTEVALKRAARQVKENCGQAKDDNGKAVGPWGKTTIQVQLGHEGRSKGTTVPAPYTGKPTGTCVERAFTNLAFPPWQGQDAQVDWEVELIEPGKEKK